MRNYRDGKFEYMGKGAERGRAPPHTPHAPAPVPAPSQRVYTKIKIWHEIWSLLLLMLVLAWCWLENILDSGNPLSVVPKPTPPPAEV